MKFCKTICTLLFLCYLCSSYAQKWVNVSPFEGSSGIAGYFISEDEGWIYQKATFKSNSLHYTHDGAQTFEKIFQFEDSLTRSTFASL